MRQGQQNRRGRGRNRKSQNPLTRSFESNGPDVKIRGTPSHIAEKYMSLARDAHSSGDPVLAENYLQHAEHYNRIIMAFREQQVGPGGDIANGGMARPRHSQVGEPIDGDDFDDDGDDMGFDGQPPMMTGHEPQPQMQHRAYDQPRGPRPEHQRQEHHRHEHHRDRDRDRDRDRPHRERHHQPQHGQSGEAGQHPQQQPRGDVGGGRGEPAHRRRERFAGGSEQPDFLRRPVRRPRREGEVEEGSRAGEPAPAPVGEGSGE
jgi:hypothetical protein